MKTRNEQSPSFIRRAVDRRGLVQFASATCACALLGGAALFHAHVRTRVTEEGYRLSRLSAEQQQLLRERDRLTLQTAQLLRPARIEELARKAGMGPPSSDRVVVLASAREYGVPRRAPVATAMALRGGAPRAASP
jgi:cell division protein FtsL